jgi:hypothetical protein
VDKGSWWWKGPHFEDYTTLKDSTRLFGVNKSVSVMDYICQVPRHKTWANLIIRIWLSRF